MKLTFAESPKISRRNSLPEKSAQSIIPSATGKMIRTGQMPTQ